MPINFHPKPGMVLICDYETGFIPPEMTKKRRVVVISPYQLNKRSICTIVPLSTTAPENYHEFHYKIPAGKYKFLSDAKDSWVKSDMIATISSKRLDRIRIGQSFLSPSLNSDDFIAVIQCVKLYLDFEHWIKL